MKVGCYIDGFNLYHAVKELKRPELRWLNLHALARSFLDEQDELARVVYFTAVRTRSPEKYWRHREYISAIRAIGVDVIESNFLRRDRFCEGYQRYCRFDDEKQTDVALAIQALSDVYSARVNRVILVTADSDQLPLVRSLRAMMPEPKVEIAAPPGRMREARSLCAAATRFREISEGRLRTCLLARNVLDKSGHIVARCPGRYLPASAIS